MNCNKEQMLLYAITDRSWLNGDTLYFQVEKALEGGATFLQLREKQLSENEIIEEAFELKRLCQAYKIPLIINDSVDIALKTDADGVQSKTAYNGQIYVGNSKVTSTNGVATITLKGGESKTIEGIPNRTAYTTIIIIMLVPAFASAAVNNIKEFIKSLLKL